MLFPFRQVRDKLQRESILTSLPRLNRSPPLWNTQFNFQTERIKANEYAFNTLTRPKNAALYPDNYQYGDHVKMASRDELIRYVLS